MKAVWSFWRAGLIVSGAKRKQRRACANDPLELPTGLWVSAEIGPCFITEV